MLFCADFETTTNKEDCRVWAYSIIEIGNYDNFHYGATLDDFMQFCNCKTENHTMYFHNEKFDAEFMTYWLFRNGFTYVADRTKFKDKTFTTLISDKGQYYSLEICFHKTKTRTQKVTILNSLNIIPLSVKQIAKAFGLPISKLEIDYNAHNSEVTEITKEEVDYIKNDVEIVARALDILFKQGHTKMTIGANALADYKNRIGKKTFEIWFPEPQYDSSIRQCYKGGFTYLNPKYKGVTVGEGVVLDINSLYPAKMRYCKLPYGQPIYFDGQYEQDDIYCLYIQNISCQFEVKKDHIPTIQIKGGRYSDNEYLEKTDIEDEMLCLTNVDLELFFEQYEVYNLEYHGGYKFKGAVGMFNDYIDSWTEVKIKATEEDNKGMRTVAKLFLNNLYGKFSVKPVVQSKYPVFIDGQVKYKLGAEEPRKAIYLPVGAFITAYARAQTIRSAQAVYERFIYADTDSLHLLGLEEPKGLDIHPSRLGAWKHESSFYKARFLRQKTYMEYGWEKADKSDLAWKITVAGMPESCYEHVTFDNFHIGKSYKGKLQAKKVIGGIVLDETTFTLK